MKLRCLMSPDKNKFFEKGEFLYVIDILVCYWKLDPMFHFNVYFILIILLFRLIR